VLEPARGVVGGSQIASTEQNGPLSYSTMLSARRIVRPALCSNHVARPRLFEMLDRGGGGGLTLLVAPAGYGKTTLLTAWAADSSRSVAWLTLTEADGDLVTFVRHLVASVQAVAPDFGDSVLGLLPLRELPAPELISSVIGAELADLPDPLVLVLDEYETLGDLGIHVLVGELLRTLPPNVQIAIASRNRPSLPIGLLRGRGQLVELGPRELRFQPVEVQSFLASATEAELSAEAVASLGARTDGWPVCLRLAALVLEEQSDPVAWVREFQHGSHQFVEELLLDEVLALQSPEAQDFLLRTSILDAVCAELCDALLQPDTPATGSHALLALLERDQGLIEPITESGPWYRYPALLQDALRYRLRGRLTQAQIADLHRRAYHWLAAHGLVDEAVAHALTGGEPDWAATLVEESVGPALLTARAWLLNFRNRFEASPVVLAQLEAVLDRDDNGLAPERVDVLRAEASTARATSALVLGNGHQLMQLARHGYELLPRQPAYPRALAECFMGVSHHFLGDTATGVQFLETVCVEEADDTALRRQHALWALSFIFLMAARPRAAREAAQRLLAASPEDRPLSRTWAHFMHGVASYELDRLDEATRHFLEVDRLRHAAHRLVLRNSLLGLARIEQVRGDPDAARITLDALEALPDVAQQRRNLLVARVFAARMAFDCDDADTAAAALSDVRLSPPMIPLETVSGSPILTRARLLIAVGGESNLTEASQVLDELEIAAESINESVQRSGVQAVRGLLHQARGDVESALRCVRRAVADAATGGLVRTFVDLGPPMKSLLGELARQSAAPEPYVAQLIAAFPTASGRFEPATPSRRGTQIGPGLVESLTPRESEILGLLDVRLSNKEIAASLQISSETVKRHISNIYQKLMVGSRREAVARAHAQGLLTVDIPGQARVRSIHSR
jgi:LuxR family transcriptional regulator, maltose regulon positive regulatory protein